MDCLTEMLSDTIDAVAQNVSPGAMLTDRGYIALVNAIAVLPCEKDRPVMVDKLSELLSLLDSYKNPPSTFAELVRETIKNLNNLDR